MLNASIGEEQNIFFESVFVLSEVGNMEVFDNNRTANNTLPCIAMGCAHSACLPHTIQVWGIASFIVVTGLSTTSYLINES